ncbi:MAG: LysM peptidoglycan-binding domain-containing protein [Candidatus Sericytochromatia bacterium]|nr:LysM peptidoglycan-binding domain-containing protein [Candidatus Sericytochromatia bacterium]
MNASPSYSSRRNRTQVTAPAGVDPIGAFLLNQRREFVGSRGERPDYDSGEKVTDLGEIARILSNCVAVEQPEEDLVLELLMLEAMLEDVPVKSQAILQQLGELGDEVRDGLLPPGMINVDSLRRRTRRLRQQLSAFASRVSAALVMFFTGTPALIQAAHAAEDSPKGFAVANAPLVRVIDSVTGQGVSGVQIKTMEERLIGTTDTQGQATLSEGYLETDLLSFEKDGYDMYLLDRTQMSARNLVSMKPLKGLASAGAGGARGAAAGASAGRSGLSDALSPTRPGGAGRALEGPKLAHGGAGHAPHLTAPKSPAKPGVPELKLPVRPRAKGAEAHLPAKPELDAKLPHAAGAHGVHKPDGAHAPASPQDKLRLAMGGAGSAHKSGAHGASSHSLPGHEAKAPSASAHSGRAGSATHASKGGGHAAPHAAPAKAGGHAAAVHAEHKDATGGHQSGHEPVADAAAAGKATREVRLPVRPKMAAGSGHAALAAHPGGHDAPTSHAAPEAHGGAHASAASHGGHAGKSAAAHGGASHLASHDTDRQMSTPALPLRPRATRTVAHGGHAETAHVVIPRRLPQARYHLSEHQAQAPAGGGALYRVRPGDTLSGIAKRTLGSAGRWNEIYQANRDSVPNPSFLRVGQNLSLPTVSVAGRSGRSTYRVRPGDCLYTIASSQLGNGRRWQAIWQMNRERIRNARIIHPGQVLMIPNA